MKKLIFCQHTESNYMNQNSIQETMKILFFIVSFLFVATTPAESQSLWSFECHGGEGYNVPMPLTISQQGYPGIKLTAHYYTEPFTPPFYMDLRLSCWQNNRSWEIEFIHHKLYLDNTTSEVQKFNISHGFNMLFLNRGFDQKTFRYRAGLGIVITHPESNIRGKEFGDSENTWDLGYYLSGPVINLAIGKPIRLGERIYINAEAKTTFAYTFVQVADGHADVYSLAFHLVLGIGVNLNKPKEK
jgi:hypothetical protein